MNKIQRVSAAFKIFFQICFVIYPILLVYAWYKAPVPVLEPFINLITQEYPILHPLSLKTRLLGFLANLMLDGSITLLILYFLIQLFNLYKQGIIFTLQNVNYIKYIGYALITGQCLAPVLEGLMGLILTWNNPPGHRFASMTVNGTDAGIILTACLIILISWIMGEACKIREELDHIV